MAQNKPENYIFFLPPNAPDQRDHMIEHDPEVAQLEARHYAAAQALKQAKADLAEVEPLLEDKQPAIRIAAAEERGKRERIAAQAAAQAETEASARKDAEADAERSAQ